MQSNVITKQCSIKAGCGIIKPITEFTTGRNQCKECRAKINKKRLQCEETRKKDNETSRKWRARNKKNVVAYKRKYNSSSRKKHTCALPPRKTHIDKRYGMSDEDYNRLLEVQNYSCGICGILEKDFVNNYKGKRTLTKLFVDHCHDTGKVRGLLCDKCNRGIGLLGDKKDDIIKALEYLS